MGADIHTIEVRFNHFAKAVDEVLAVFESDHFDLALIDLGMPGMRGDRVALALKQADPAVATVLITGWDSVPEDLPEDAFDFRLQKPFGDLEEVERTIEKGLALRQARVAERKANHGA